jgi:hypothetical protein
MAAKRSAAGIALPYLDMGSANGTIGKNRQVRNVTDAREETL